MLDFILWIIFGALVGWVASMIMGTNERQGALGNIVVGILGALLGGFIARATVGADVTGFNLTSFFVALGGAIVLLWIYKMVTRTHVHH